MISSKRLGPAVSHRHARSWRLALPQTSQGSQDDRRAGYGVMDVVDSEHDAMQAQRVGGGFSGPAPSAAGAWYLVSSSLL